MSALVQPLEDIRIGNDAAWALKFYTEVGGRVATEPVLTVMRDQYYAEIEATLPGDLSGGSYRFVIEGMTDDDYETLHKKSPTVVRLYLWWRDTASSVGSYVQSAFGITGLSESAVKRVAELSITKVSRRVGERRYEVVVEAAERVYVCASKRLDAKLPESGFSDALKTLAKRGGFDVTVHLDEIENAAVATELEKEKVSFETNTVIADALTHLSRRLEQAVKKTGRGTLLIRNGALTFGIRKIPLESGDKDLSWATGLVETELLGKLAVTPSTDAKDGKQRRQFRLTLKGRPDLKPGDVVTFEPPTGEDPASAALGAALPALGAGGAGKRMRAYVSSVQHSLGRLRGFTTIVTAVELWDAGEDWDTPSEAGSRAYAADAGSAGTSASGGEQAANAIKRAAQAARDAVHTAEVGEVRVMYVKGSNDGPGQTLRILRGLSAPDGKANQANRLSVDAGKSAPIDRVAYASPFAWGKCGLVLPRYPGTRVVVVHRNGEASDPIEVGALWEADTGPESKGGDWWLILPAAVAEGSRANAADGDTIQPYSDKASDDLIDAEGNRVIEVGSLTIRVGPDALDPAGARPEKAAANSLMISFGQDDTTSILLKDGEIVLKAKKIVLDGEESVVLKGPGVTAKLASGAMDVS